MPTTIAAPRERPVAHRAAGADVVRYLAPLGRALFVAIFLFSFPGHFSRESIDYAASAGVPLPALAVPLSGIIAAAGAVLVLIGWFARVGAWLLILFLAPVTFMMHAFWTYEDAATAEMQMINFMKNLSMLGAAFFIASVGAGPVSLDEWRLRRAARTPAL